MLKRTNRLLLAALLLGWLFDFLFWGKAEGISFAIFVSACLLAGFGLARAEEIRPARAGLWLLPPIAFFAVMSFVRLEPLSSFLNLTLTLLLMAVLAVTFTGGRWLAYSVGDYAKRLIMLAGSALGRASILLAEQRKAEREEGSTAFSWRDLIPWLRGLLLALPVLAFFAVLLASADPIFSDNLDRFLDFFNIENLGEYIFRGFIILAVSYLLVGVLTHAYLKSGDEGLVGEEKSWLSPFLGFTEAAVVLGSVDLLFGAFVLVQFRYFFGGETNIALDGFTYSEYARRGFGELVAVAVFSLLLFLGLSAIAQRQAGRQRRVFSGLGIALVALVVVILNSAYLRLLLYESAYGFTRLRTYTHVFMIWLGLLLLAVVILELLRRQRAFALAALLAALGFGISLNLLNVDAFIVRQNVARARRGYELDIPYLASLSQDAVPALAEMYRDELDSGSSELSGKIGGALACHAALHDEYLSETPWQSFHLSRWQARQVWGTPSEAPGLAGDQAAYQDARSRWYVQVNGEEQPCVDYTYRYD